MLLQTQDYVGSVHREVAYLQISPINKFFVTEKTHFMAESSVAVTSSSESPPDDTGSATQSRFRWKMESEDSSYDSDYENSDAMSPRDTNDSNVASSVFHDEVSRTVSDTLAAEYADYVNDENSHPLAAEYAVYVNDDNPHPQGEEESKESSTSSTLQSAIDEILLEPHYTSRVEFALKLGYTEQQVQIALHKLGPRPGQNELLAELIKLGASARCSSLVAPESIVSNVSNVDVSVGGGSEVVDLPLCSPSDRQESIDESGNLRPIVIDGSNVAMSHGNKEVFSCRGITLCVDWFKSRGHKEITVFVPKWRKESSRPDARIIDQEILLELEKERRLVFTPSRLVGGRRLVCYDDRYILKLAAANDGIVVSNDNYRDLANESPDFKKVVEERLLMYSFVNDRFMPPDDPLGRHGPNLDNFLRKQAKPPESLPPPCPYGKKCTYGNKCKYYHPERGNLPQKSVTERLSEQAKIQIQEVKARGNKSRDSSPGDSLKAKLTGTVSAPASSESKALRKTPLSRTRSVAPSLTALPRELTETSEDDDKRKEATNLSSNVSTFGTSCPSVCQQCSTDVASSWTNKMGHGVQAPVWAHPAMMSGMRSVTPTPTTCASSGSLFYGDHGGHLSVAKRLSDPENKNESGNGDGTNLHRKLQRQLTLNPTYDPRLFHLQCFAPPPGQHLSMIQRNVQSGEGAESTNHRPLTRHGSAEANQQVWNKNEGIMPNLSNHPCATRIASAPDSYCQWPPTHNSPMHRLGSTSDTQLNLFHDIGGGFVHEIQSDGSNSMWPMHMRPGHHWQRDAIHMSRPQTPLGQQPIRPSSVPPHQMAVGPRQTSATCPDDVRGHIFYKLSSIFPPEQVQAAMLMYPEETNPQKICATILSMFPPKGQ